MNNHHFASYNRLLFPQLMGFINQQMFDWSVVFRQPSKKYESVRMIVPNRWKNRIPRCSMYGIFTYIWVIFGVNVGKYSIHGASGIDVPNHQLTFPHQLWLQIFARSFSIAASVGIQG